ncbi:MAG: phage holin family protein [Gammaproteobacteria bacterium]|nr:MAG: phage holin family protein [Gammaproteobacteria bacterium]TLZ11010.1 MAG: phage holin family protein [Gammaproteobacteria bacterium]TLZ11342.1 MAG: phage holin family protein [Gammaproteobacteria bacterium]TLZ13434.1 MAG: phage holin family protein [Gammaproteobacteria bacterium]TLZ18111.1 MAG: phage holin family protein [Gammaproteobacteria bacterium]
MRGFLLRAVITALGLWLASAWVSGVRIHGPGTLILAALLLGVVNAVVRPIAFVLTLPLTLLTLGLFLLVLNAAMVALVAAILPGFHLGSFRAALFTWIIVWLTGWVASALIGHQGIERLERR